MTELPKTNKTPEDLIAIVDQNPGIRVAHDIGDIFEIKSKLRGEERIIYTTVKPEDNYDENIPFISHKIPDTDISIYIRFFPEDLCIKKEKFRKTEENVDLPFDDEDREIALELIMAAKKGLEMMRVLKAIPQEEKENIPIKYRYSVDESRFISDPFSQRNALEMCLKAINKVLQE